MENKGLLVVVGAGPLGTGVMQEGLKHGYRVRMVTRSGKVPHAPQEVELLAANVANTEESIAACRGAQVVFQCAQPAYHRWVEEFPALQAGVLAGAEAAGARLVFADNLYMYGDPDGKHITEDSPQKPHTRKGKLRKQIADMILDAHRQGRLEVAIGRGSDFYGPYGLGSVLGERAIIPMLQGKSASLTGRLDLPHTFTFTQDFAKALFILGERPEAPGRAWIVPSPKTLTQAEVMQIAAHVAGVPLKMSGMGKLMMMVGGLFIPEARESVEMMYEFEKPYIADHSQFAETFGDHATAHETAMQITIDWYRQHLNQNSHA